MESYKEELNLLMQEFIDTETPPDSLINEIEFMLWTARMEDEDEPDSDG